MTTLTDPLRYDRGSDVIMRLHDTVIRYRGKPVHVKALSEESLFVKIKYLDKNKFETEHVHSSDIDLDISSPPLGYLNANRYAFYVSRIPTRKQKQGFCTEVSNYFVESINGHNELNVTKYFYDKPLYDTITNHYPTGPQALEIILSKKDINSIAFHRKFALLRDELNIIKLKSIGRTIGWQPPNKDYFIIPEQYANPIYETALRSQGLEIRT